MRTPIIAGNWKMNKTVKEAEEFVSNLDGKLPDPKRVQAVVIPPDLFIDRLIQKAKGTALQIGAQNCYWKESGAYTGETSPAALRDLGVQFVVLGHSERREYFHETDEDVNKKVHAVLDQSMTPIICVGETSEEQDAGKTEEKIKRQVEEALKEVSQEQASKLIIAYEPIWAIGTGKTASAAQANDRAKLIRETVAGLYSNETADQLRIQYGGSVKPENIKELLTKSDIDGALVGGASLETESFMKLLEAASDE